MYKLFNFYSLHVMSSCHETNMTHHLNLNSKYHGYRFNHYKNKFLLFFQVALPLKRVIRVITSPFDISVLFNKNE